MKERQGKIGDFERLLWVVWQDFLGRGRGEGERLAAGELVRRLISSSSSSAQVSWGKDKGHTFKSHPVGPGHSPSPSMQFDLGQLCELCVGVDKGGTGERVPCLVVIQTAWSCRPEIQALIPTLEGLRQLSVHRYPCHPTPCNLSQLPRALPIHLP